MSRYLLMMVLVLFFASGASAQVFSTPTKPLTLEITPSLPEPQTPIQIRVTGSAQNLQDATAEWYVDGARAPHLGADLVTTITAPRFGTSVTVGVVVTSGDSTFGSTRTIRPASVDLLWDTDTYVPPTYRGRRLPSSQATVQLEAYPRVAGNDGKLLSRGALSYTWKKNGATLADISGRGRANATLPAPRLFSTDTITVEVSAPSQGVVANNSVRVTSVDPFVQLYYDHPLFGVLFHRELGVFTTIYDSEARIIAEPFLLMSRHPTLIHSSTNGA